MKVTLIGSTRFHERFKELNAKLSKQGHVVYSVALAEKAGDVITPAEKTPLDLVHLQKILESDAVIVIGCQEDGTYYRGESTRRELEWALMNDKAVYVEKAWSMIDREVVNVEDTAAMRSNLIAFIEGLADVCKPREPAILQKGGHA